jgi:hypothetical protein
LDANVGSYIGCRFDIWFDSFELVSVTQVQRTLAEIQTMDAAPDVEVGAAAARQTLPLGSLRSSSF